MAAARHGGYRDVEFGSRESSLKKLMHVDDYYYYKGRDNDRFQNCDSDRRGGRRYEVKSRDSRENFRVKREKEVIVEVVNGGNDFSIKRKSGFNGGDDVDAPESYVQDNEASLSGNRVKSSPDSKKRKLSPNVSDREVKARDLSKNKVFATSPKNPLLSKRNCQGVTSKPISPDNGDMGLVRKPEVVPCSVESDVPASQTGLCTLSPQEKVRSGCHEFGMLEEVDVGPPNILSSRWAYTDCSPDGKVLVSDNGDMPRRRTSNTGSVSLEASPELGEITRNGCEGLQMKSSEYVGTEGFVEPYGDDGYPDSSNSVETKKDGSYHSYSDPEEKHCSPHAGEQVDVPTRSIDMLQGCRSVREFERLNKIAEGTYGIVHRARDKRTGEVVALKKVKMDRENEGFPLTSLREINILLSSNHPSIVDVKEVVMDDLDSIFMVMEYMEHDLKGLMETRKERFSQSEVKCLMLQLLQGVEYLHDNWVIHRDLKTSNVLLNNRGELKICDFGLSRQYGSRLNPYTQLVVTLWYRAPELLLGERKYSTAIDMWSLGCIMAELLAKEPLFSGKSEIDQIEKIFQTLGTPSEANWPGFSKLPGAKAKFTRHRDNLRKKFPPASFTGSPVLSEAGFDLLKKLLTYDPMERITAHDAVNHEWFREAPLPKSKESMPTFPVQHAQDRRTRRTMKSPDPLEEQRRRELQQGESGTGGLFG